MLIIIFFFLLIGYFLGSRPYYYRKSYNFDGRVFLNQNKIKQGSFLRVLKWLFTRKPPNWEYQNYELESKITTAPKSGFVITPIIHASFLIQTPKFNILTDPIWSERASPFSFIGPKRVYIPPLAINDLPKLDMVLISHNHYDHMDVKTIKKLEHLYSPTFITGLGNKCFLEKIGVKKVIELDWWQQAYGLPIHFVPAQHFSGRGLFDRNFTLWGGFVVNSGSQNLYFAGDTGYGSLFKDIRDKFSVIDFAILPIGAYIPREFMKNMHLSPDDAVQAMLDLDARYALGMHFDSFAALADEAQFSAGKDLNDSLISKGVDLRRFVASVPGKIYHFDSSCF